MYRKIPRKPVEPSTEDLDNTELDDHGNSHNTPKTLHKKWTGIISRLGLDLLSIVTWLLMLAFALLLWACNGKRGADLSFHPERLVDATRPLSTLFPIMFAASVGRSLRSLAGWLLERGCRIGLLDQLIGSTSVANTIATQMHIRPGRSALSIYTALVVVALWLLSPLGSQSILRAVVVRPYNTTSSTTFPYMNLDNAKALRAGGDRKQFNTPCSDMLLAASLVSPAAQRDGAFDNWGHVKIPRIEALVDTQPDAEGWHTVPQESVGASDYSSLAGIPVEDLPQTPVNVALKTWYWNLQCEPEYWRANESDIKPYDRNDLNITRDGQPGLSPLIIYPLEGGNRTQKFCDIGTETPENTTERNRMPVHCPDLPARKFGFLLSDGWSTVIYGDCFISTQHVEALVSCSDGRCQASRMRLSSRPDLHKNVTVLDMGGSSEPNLDSYYSTSVAGLFFDWLVDMIPTQSRIGATGNALAGAIADPTDPFRDFRTSKDRKESTFSNTVIRQNVSSAEFSNRFAQFMNTYWITLIGGQLTTGSKANAVDGQTIGAPATIISAEEIVTCHKAWLMAFTVATIITLLCAVASLWLTLQLRGPKLAWDVSTAVRDSPYVTMPRYASHLDDDERSRVMSQSRVILTDVTPGKDVGHIAISSVCTEDEGGKKQRLHMGRLYN